MRKPFYRSDRECWYVKDNAGKFIRLDPEETTAFDIWQQMRVAGNIAHPDVCFAVLAERWLEEIQHQVEPQKLDLMGNYLGQFVDFSDAKRAADIAIGSVLKWLKEPKLNHKGRTVAKVWSLATQRDAAHTVKRVLTWAVEKGYLARNPIAGIKLKTPRSRVRTVTESEHAALVAKCRTQKKNGKHFAQYLIASHCGARPQQIREVTREQVHADGKCWVFREHKTAEKTGKPLAVYLSPCLQTLTKILAANRPKGPLFVQENGKPWGKGTVVKRFSRLRDELGLEKVVAYSYRHK